MKTKHGAHQKNLPCSISSTSKKYHKRLGLVSTILAGEIIFFLPFVLVRLFKPSILEVFEIDNTQLGLCFSVYGIVAMIAYFFGGVLADKYPPNKLMSMALWTTALGGFVLMTFPGFNWMVMVYGFWGLSTIMLFWAAMIKATRSWGGDQEQGSAFGWLEGGRGLVAALVSTILVGLFVTSSTISKEDYSIILFATSVFTAVTGVLVWFFVKVDYSNMPSESINFLESVKQLKNQKVWLQAIIIVAAYVGYKITENYGQYTVEALDYSEQDASVITAIIFWLRPISAIVAGYLANKYFSSKVVFWSFILMLFGSLCLSFGLKGQEAWMILSVVGLSVVGIYAARSVYFALVQESGIGLAKTGMVVGIISLIGFTPDVFVPPINGYIVDTYEGVEGHQYMFLIMSGFALIGGLATYLFMRLNASSK